MTTLKQFEKQRDFVEEASAIVNQLVVWKLISTVTEQSPSCELLEKECVKFLELINRAEKDEIANGMFVCEQIRIVSEAFNFFSNIIPECSQPK